METIYSNIKQIEYIFENFENKHSQLKNICKELRNKNVEEKYIYGLDSFFYQITIYNIEYQHYRKMHSINLNRFYSNYKYLANMIEIFVSRYITNKNVKKSIDFTKDFPKYNNLDIFTEYDFVITRKLYDSIEKSIDFLEEHLNNKKKTLGKYSGFNSDGLSLNNFIIIYQKTVDNIEYHINLIKKQKIQINNEHIETLNHSINKINLTYNIITSINIDNILSKSINCQDKIIHEKKLSKVHTELINTDSSKNP